MTEQGQGQSAPESGAEQGQEQERTFTQADLNKIAANEKRDGVSSVLSQMGVETVEDAVQLAKMVREAEEENQSELDKAEADREKYKAERDEYRKLADDRLIGVELKLALMDAGVPRERLNDALELTKRDGLAVEKDETVSGLEDAVKATLEPRSWLTETQQDPAPTPRRAADVSRQSAASTDPQQAHGQFLAGLLSNNSP